MSFGLASASWFSDFWGKITGNVIVNNMNLNCPDNLVAYWRFEGNANDYLGNVNGVLKGDASASGSLNLDGAGDYVQTNTIYTSDISNFAMSAWVLNTKIDDRKGGFIIQFRRDGNNFLAIWARRNTTAVANSQIRAWYYFTAGSGGGAVADITGAEADAILSSPNPWHVVAVLNSSTNVLLYINGIYRAKSDSSYNRFIPGGTYTTYIGRYADSSGYDFNGSIDDVIIFNKTLTAEEIKGIYNNGVSGNVCSSCIESWSCSVWSACSNNTQTRTCIDANNCGTTTSKPAVSQSCVVQNQTCTDSDGGQNYDVKGIVNSSVHGTYFDFCNGDHLSEWVCKSDGSGEAESEDYLLVQMDVQMGLVFQADAISIS